MALFAKRMKAALAATALVVVPVSSALAVTSTFDVELEIVSPLAVTTTNSMVFGRITSGATASNVQLGAGAGNCNVTTGLATIDNVALCRAAEFQLSGGAASAVVDVTYNTSLTDIGGVTGLNLTMNDNTDTTSSGSVTLDAGGTFVLSIMGDLTVPANAELPATTVPVTVDFTF